MPSPVNFTDKAYSTILNGAAEGILIAELGTLKFIFANPAVCKLFNYTEDEILDLSVNEIHPQDKLEEVVETFKAQARGDFDLALDVPCERKDGSVFYANINTSKVVIDGVECNVGFFSDVSELRRANKALEKTKQDLESIFNGIPHPTIVMDAQHNVLSGNTLFEKLLGEAPSSYKEMKCWQVLHNAESHEPPGECPFKNLHQTESAVSVEMAVEALDGYFIVSCTPLYNEQGNVEKIVHILTDITARKKAEDELKRSEARYSSIVENIDDVMYIHDLEGTIIDVNDAAFNTMGYKREELVGQKLSLLNGPQEAKKFRERIERLLRDGSIIFQGKQIKKNGDTIEAQISAKVVSHEGKGVVQSFARDLTQLRTLEETVRVSQKLDSLGVLAGGIAHDFNNLLSGVFGCVDMAQLVSNEPEVLQYLDMSLRSLERARDLTRQLLTFSKGGSPVKHTASLVEVVTEAAQFALHGASVACDIRLPSDLWLCDYDRNQIHQVVENIVINAIQAMPERGVLVIEAENMTLPIDNRFNLIDGKYVCLSFTDNGVGIPEPTISKIFDPFYTTKQSGTGLGLATSYSIVKRHGGNIEAKSIVGQGTTMRVLLPTSEESVSDVYENRSGNVISTQAGRVLLMDDEPLILEAVGEMLRLIGFSVQTAHSGEEALRTLRAQAETEKPFSAIILDLTVPGGSGGKEIISDVLKLSPKTPVVVSSGYSQDPVMASPELFGFAASIHKPFVTSELAVLLRDLIDRTG